MNIDEDKQAIVEFLEMQRGAAPAAALWAHWLRQELDVRRLEPALGSLVLDGRITLEDSQLRLAPLKDTIEAKVSRHLASAWVGLELLHKEIGKLDDPKRQSLDTAFKQEIPQIGFEELHSALERFTKRAFAILSVGPE
jgi:hypothetical protein